MRRDMLAGLAVGAVLVPQGLAYGELAGLSPVTGLYTALGALLLYALVGSSRYLRVGPESSVAIVTAAFLGPLIADSPERAADLASLREAFVRLVEEADQPVLTVVLNAEGMVDMDITGAEALAELLDHLHERGTRLVMARVRASVRTTMQRLGVEERLGAGKSI